MVGSLLKLCWCERPLLSTTLQTRFIGDRTPLHSVVCSVDIRRTGDHVPPVVEALLDLCTLPLLSAAREDIEIACCERNDNALLHILRRHPALRPGTSVEAGHPTVTVDNDATSISFIIPKFLDQMLADSKVVFPFVLKGGWDSIHACRRF